MLCQQDPEQSHKIYLLGYGWIIILIEEFAIHISEEKIIWNMYSKVNTLDSEHDKVQRLSGEGSCMSLI